MTGGLALNRPATHNRGKISEEDTTETPMYVNRGGRLTILQEDQGQLLTLAGEPDGKLRAAGH
ncbi:hypothetical protein F8C00_04065 [Escherichia coli]|nr:hypothetical protein [Escherichia coli]